MRHPDIPRTWTGREALAIAEALRALVDDICDVYAAEIRVELLAREMKRDALIPSSAPASVLPVDLTPF